MEERRLDGRVLSDAEWEAVLARMTVVVASLPEIPRRVYLLSARDGRSHDEIAERLGIDVAEVSRQLASALVGIDRAMHPD
jgi:DNA-directed RNA polymerase specialized sigma24 family protein